MGQNSIEQIQGINVLNFSMLNLIRLFDAWRKLELFFASADWHLIMVNIAVILIVCFKLAGIFWLSGCNIFKKSKIIDYKQQ